MEDAKKSLDEPVPLTAKERRDAENLKNQPDKQVDSLKSKKVSETQPNKEEPPKVDEPKSDKTAETAPPEKPQASGIAPPAALTKEEKAVWDTVPKEIQEAFLRRERDTQKGVEQLKAKYQPIEDVLAPVKPILQQNRLTEAHAVKQLFDWHVALAQPDKAAALNALRQLAQSHRIDLAQLNPQPQSQAQQPPQQIEPLQQIESLLDQRLQPVNQQLASYAAEIQRQKLEAANNEIAVFSRDKPHIEKPGVKPRMAEILTTASQFGRPVTLQEAYDEAVWGMPELRNEILQEQEAKREAEFKAAQEANLRKLQEAESERMKREAEAAAEAKRKEVEALERARRASVSPRSTAPVGQIQSSGPKKPQSVADTLRSVLKESRA